MENQLSEESRQVDKDKIGIEYRLELINYQDQLFQARRKLKQSKDKMEALEQKLKEYLRNKENQLAEIMFTAHINAQRIESQTKTQVEVFLGEMEKEIENAQKQLDIIEGKVAAPEPKMPLFNLEKNQDDTEQIKEHKIEKQELGSVGNDSTSSLKLVKAKVVNESVLPESEPEPQSVDNLPTGIPEEKHRVDHRTHHNSHRRLGYKATVKRESVSDQDQEQSMVNIFTGMNDEITPNGISRDQQETIRCDSFVDVRYYSGSREDQVIEHHALYAAAEVFVPDSNYSVRYTKVSSDIVATLMRYDNVILNDVYPFDIIEPSLNNISKYFFNCIQDVMALMDLGLHSLTIHELPDFKLEITARSRDIDHQMHTSEDMLQDIRRDLPDQIELPTEPPTNLKGRLSQILKKR